MVNENLNQYIAQKRSEHVTDAEIMTNLTQAGWQLSDVNSGLNPIDDVPRPSQPISPQNSPNLPTSSLSDSFEHVLLFISLYVLMTSIALTLHLFTDKYVATPNTSQNIMGYVTNSPFSAILLRGYLAALIVSSPLFSFFFLKVTRRTVNFPSLRKNPTRKKLTYFTLVITFIIMVSNVISIVFSFLNGNVSINAMIHFLITVGISGLIFAYYLNEVKVDRKLYA